MATYKVIQDIEAEDHIIGPLSLRQFIFAIVAVLCFYFTYLVFSKHVGFLAILFLPPGLFAGFFAFPFGKDQPTEIWALAKIRFLIKPHRRIWDQSGAKELVTVTAPKKVEEHRTDGLSPVEVHSRLNALADTIDSRGWAIKNVNLNMYAQPGQMPTGAASDRLIDASTIPQEVPTYDIQASDDILDPQSNPIAQQFDQMITASAQNHHQQIVDMMSQPQAAPTATPPHTPPNDYWFLNQPTAPPKLGRNQAVFADPSVVLPGSDDQVSAGQPTADEEALATRLKTEHDKPESVYSNMRTIQPLSEQVPPPAAKPAAPHSNPQLMQLAGNNDLNISTIARQANQSEKKEDDGEVVISLH